MNKHHYKFIVSLLFVGIIILSAGCGNKPLNSNTSSNERSVASTGVSGGQGQAGTDDVKESADPTVPVPGLSSASPSSLSPKEASGQVQDQTHEQETVQVIADPQAIAVLINKTNRLPEGYVPNDLVEPDVPFIFKEKLEKRKLRKGAAEALEKLFRGAQKEGIFLAGVSGYRSQATQEALFNNYAKKSGKEAANKYSAKPGYSEHQTGLAIDVSASTGKCAAEDCFAGTDEANWLAEHAAEYGFIIRYPEGKDSITGYQYEPWHLRYVGAEIARDIADKGITLEEYYDDAVMAAKQKQE